MKTAALIVALWLCSITMFGQTKLVIGLSDTVKYSPYDQGDIDSIVFLTYDGANLNFEGIEVYYDNEFEDIAHRSYMTTDTCILYDYWRNGKVKKESTYCLNVFPDHFPVWCHEKIYCENGQLIRSNLVPNSETPADQKTQLITNYYCNGNKENEFTHTGFDIDGN